MIANAIISRAEGKISRRLAAEIAAEMLDPPVFGGSLNAAMVRQARNKQIAEALRQVNIPVTAGAIQSAVVTIKRLRRLLLYWAVWRSEPTGKP
jgi:hypothetical protein